MRGQFYFKIKVLSLFLASISYGEGPMVLVLKARALRAEGKAPTLSESQRCAGPIRGCGCGEGPAGGGARSGLRKI